MTDYSCPAEGCDYEAETTNQVEGHINAMSDPAHEDKEALRAVVGDDADSGTTETEGQQADEDHPEGTSDGGADGSENDGGDADNPEQASDQPDGADEGETDHPDDGPESGAMPTDDEYDRVTSGTTGDSTTPSDGADGGSTTTDDRLDLPGLPVDPWTLAMLAGLVLTVLLAWYWLRAGDDSPEPAAEDLDADEQDTSGGSDTALVEEGEV